MRALCTRMPELAHGTKTWSVGWNGLRAQGEDCGTPSPSPQSRDSVPPGNTRALVHRAQVPCFPPFSPSLSTTSAHTLSHPVQARVLALRAAPDTAPAPDLGPAPVLAPGPHPVAASRCPTAALAPLRLPAGRSPQPPAAVAAAHQATPAPAPAPAPVPAAPAPVLAPGPGPESAAASCRHLSGPLAPAATLPPGPPARRWDLRPPPHPRPPGHFRRKLPARTGWRAGRWRRPGACPWQVHREACRTCQASTVASCRSHP